MKFLFSIVFLLLAGALLAAPAQAQGLEVPSAWAGVWDITTTEYECDLPDITDQYTDRDTLCTGEILSFGSEGGITPTCEGIITETTLDMTCSYTGEITPGCTVTFSYSVSLTRSGDTASGTESTEIIYDGDCFFTGECFDNQLSATRVAPEPEDCTNVAVTAPSWGALKARF